MPTYALPSFLIAPSGISRRVMPIAAPMVAAFGFLAPTAQAQATTYISPTVKIGSFGTPPATGFLSTSAGTARPSTGSAGILADTIPDAAFGDAGSGTLKSYPVEIGAATGHTGELLGNAHVTDGPAPGSAPLMLFVLGMMVLFAVRVSQKGDELRRMRAAAQERGIADRSRWLSDVYGSEKNELNTGESTQMKVCRANRTSIAGSSALS